MGVLLQQQQQPQHQQPQHQLQLQLQTYQQQQLQQQQQEQEQQVGLCQALIKDEMRIRIWPVLLGQIKNLPEIVKFPGGVVSSRGMWYQLIPYPQEMTPVKIGLLILSADVDVADGCRWSCFWCCQLDCCRNWCWSSEAFPEMTCWKSLAEDSRQSLWSPASRGGADKRSGPGWCCYYYCSYKMPIIDDLKWTNRRMCTDMIVVLD